MTGHHVYTRSWYKYGSRVKNAGTFTIELTDGIFGTNTDSVINNTLNPFCSKTPESLAMRDTNQSLLRIFHPTDDTTMISRSYYVIDKITGAGSVAYSTGLIFKGSDNERFLRNPSYAFTKIAYESYEAFVARVPADTPVYYSSSYDPLPENYSEQKVFSREAWENDFGLNSETFPLVFIALCKSITAKNNRKVALQLPANATSEQLILAMLTILPVWLRNRFGATANWVGAMDGGSASSIEGIQLVCYLGETASSQANFPIIDLSGNKAHKHLETLTTEERSLSKWYWDNIENPDVLNKFFEHMSNSYGDLVSKMPFSVAAQCFWLWRTFSVVKVELTFTISVRAVYIIANAFGASVSKLPGLLNSVLIPCITTINAQLPYVSTASITADVGRAVCILALGDVAVENENIYMRDMVDPLFRKLLEQGDSGKLMPFFQYYNTVLGKSTSINENIYNTVKVLISALSRTDQGAEAAAEILLRFAISQRGIVLCDEVNSDLSKLYKAIVKNLSVAGRLTSDIYSIPDDGRRINSSTLYEIEMNDRGLLNKDFPNIKYLEKLSSFLPVPHFNDIVEQIWVCESMKSLSVRTAKVRELTSTEAGTKMLKKLIDSNKRVQDDAFNILIVDFSREFTTQTGDEEKIVVIKNWMPRMTSCGFQRHTLMEKMREAYPIEIADIKMKLMYISPESLKVLRDIWAGTTIEKPLENLIIIDMHVIEQKSFLPLYGRCRDTNQRNICRGRLEFWYKKNEKPPIEWTLTLAVLSAKIEAEDISENVVTKFLRYRIGKASDTTGEKNITVEDLIAMFAAYQLLSQEGNSYGADTRDIKQAFGRKVLSLAEKNVDWFTNENVIGAFKRISSETARNSIGARIREILDKKANVISDGVLDRYYIIENDSTVDPIVSISALALFAFSLAAIVLIYLGGDPKSVFKALSLPPLLYIIPGALAVLTSVMSLGILLKGKR